MTLQLIGSNRSGSPAVSLSGGNSTSFTWSPFGGGAARTGDETSLPGFNGERQDPLSGVSHLGNGYRAYSPALRRFTCPDSESPFGIGGINPYVYCDHDPVNKTDPSGHGPITWLIRKSITLGVRLGLASAESAESMAIGLSTVGAVETGTELAIQISTGVAQQIARARGNTFASQRLGWASMGMGLAGGFGLLEGDIGKTLRRLRKSAKNYGLKSGLSEVSSLSGTEGRYRKIGDEVSEVRESLMDESSNREPLQSRSPLQESTTENNPLNNADFSLSDRNGSVIQRSSEETRSFVDRPGESDNVRSTRSGSEVGDMEMSPLPEHIVQKPHGRPKETQLGRGEVFDPGEMSSSSRGSGRHVTGKALHKNVLSSWSRKSLSKLKLRPGAARDSYLA